VLITAFAAVFISVEFSILIGVALSIVLFVPRAARLRGAELTVTSDRIVRERVASDPDCSSILLYDIEGELFFGAAPELDRIFDSLKRRTRDAGIRIVVLRLKRTRNPDMVSLERLEHFLRDMRQHEVTVLLCGVRPDLADRLSNLRFNDWLPREHVFFEEPELHSSTLKAVRYAYQILPQNSCQHCAQEAVEKARKEFYYLV
jgi:SulP family sulfate permease